MGRIAGLNMAGEGSLFPGIVGTQIMKFFELSLAKTGLSLEEAKKEELNAQAYSAARTDKANYYPGASLAEVEIICEEGSGKIIGAAAVCQGNAAQFIDPAAVAVFTGMTIGDMGWFDSSYAPPYAPVWNALISAALKARS
jgi:NADPH-dependent 2,4-dienoyl-CoA reductase/sulfur reductase-like enzyme